MPAVMLSAALLMTMASAGDGVALPTGGGLVGVVHKLSLEKIVTNLISGCEWLSNTNQIRGSALPPQTNNNRHYNYSDWDGAFRTEYSAAAAEFSFMGPVWHGGQDIKALVLARDAMVAAASLGWKNASFPAAVDSWTAAAKRGAEFTLRQQETAGPDAGLVHAFENWPADMQTSTMLEGMHGLMLLGNVTGERRFTSAAVAAASWGLRTLIPEEPGLMYDGYFLQNRSFMTHLRWNTLTRDGVGRPMNDDSIFLRASKLTHEPGLRQQLRAAFYLVLERLIVSEGPPGNWGGYVPCSGVQGDMHPRQAFWWGMPFVEAFRDSGNESHLAVAVRAGEWYMRAQRSDGGMFRHTDWQFQTSTFGQVASGSACAAILWLELYSLTRNATLLPYITRALSFVEQSHVKEAADPNMRWAVIEDSAPPGKCDSSPYALRDIATSFYAQALAMLLTAAADEQRMQQRVAPPYP